MGTQAGVQSSHRGLAEVLKAYAKPLATTPHAGGVGTRERCRHQAQLSRRPWRTPLLRDGDLIPCSMTIALLAYLPRIVHFLALNWCPHSFLWF